MASDKHRGRKPDDRENPSSHPKAKKRIGTEMGGSLTRQKKMAGRLLTL